MSNVSSSDFWYLLTFPGEKYPTTSVHCIASDIIQKLLRFYILSSIH